MQSPAQADHEAEIKQLEESLQNMKMYLENSVLKMKVDFGGGTPAEKRNYDRRVQEIQEMEDRYHFCQNLDKQGLYFGRVEFSSGFRKAAGHALDWALISVADERMGENSVCRSSFV